MTREEAVEVLKGAKGIQDGLYNITNGKIFKYKAKGGTVRTYEIVPSAEPSGELISRTNRKVQTITSECFAWRYADEYDDLWVCDQCGLTNEYMIKFCPICGARMCKGGEDTTGESL